MSRQPIDLIGHRFDKLVVRAKLDMTPSGARWLCECDCGGLVSKITTQLRRPSRIHGGCRACEPVSRSESKATHGGNRAITVGTEPLYKIWKSMRMRCADGSDKYYGAKGVKVCPEWHDYSVFRGWALANGYRYIDGVTRGDRLSIERINPAVGYCPQNCEWITGRENSRRMARARRNKESSV